MASGVPPLRFRAGRRHAHDHAGGSSSGGGVGVSEPLPGQHRCLVVVPQTVAEGVPWSWRGCYFNHQPQTEIELLKRGSHIAYISANATLKPGKEWDAWYWFLTERHGFSKKPAFVGMSRGGEYAYTWSVASSPESGVHLRRQSRLEPGGFGRSGGVSIVGRPAPPRVRQHRSPPRKILQRHRGHLPGVGGADLGDDQRRPRTSSPQSE